MAQHPPLNDEDRANLVAYLDGELDEAEARALEAKLNLDPNARTEAEALRQAWDLLDYLPRPEPSPSFTNRTLDRIATLRPSATNQVQRRRRRWLLRLAWVAAVVLAAVAGYAGASLFPGPAGAARSPETDEALVRDLRVIENLRQYQQAEDIRFLRELEHADLFGDTNAGY
jgi:anti-sigma factor RsiW